MDAAVTIDGINSRSAPACFGMLRRQLIATVQGNRAAGSTGLAHFTIVIEYSNMMDEAYFWPIQENVQQIVEYE